MEETGRRYGPAQWEAMRRMGYLGPQEERRLYHEHLAQQQKKHDAEVVEAARAAITNHGREQIRQVQAEIREERRVENFEESVRTLPDQATAAVEIDWIRAHPAMARLDRQTDKTKQIMISAEDILQAPQGKAPSKAAVYALQHWANRPGEFYKQLLGEQKKKSEDGEGKGIETEEDLAEVERLLKQVSA